MYYSFYSAMLSGKYVVDNSEKIDKIIKRIFCNVRFIIFFVSCQAIVNILSGVCILIDDDPMVRWNLSMFNLSL